MQGMRLAKYIRELRATRRANRLCPECGAAAKEGYAKCLEHHQRAKAYAAARNKRLTGKSRKLYSARCKQVGCTHQEHHKADQREWRRKIRATVFAHYGSCTCCAEADVRFLTIDHKRTEDGKSDQKKFAGSSYQLYRHLIKAGFPDYVHSHCWNCNMAKKIYGQCPHQLP